MVALSTADLIPFLVVQLGMKMLLPALEAHITGMLSSVSVWYLWELVDEDVAGADGAFLGLHGASWARSPRCWS